MEKISKEKPSLPKKDRRGEDSGEKNRNQLEQRINFGLDVLSQLQKNLDPKNEGALLRLLNELNQTLEVASKKLPNLTEGQEIEVQIGHFWLTLRWSGGQITITRELSALQKTLAAGIITVSPQEIRATGLVDNWFPLGGGREITTGGDLVIEQIPEVPPNTKAWVVEATCREIEGTRTSDYEWETETTEYPIKIYSQGEESPLQITRGSSNKWSTRGKI